MTLSDRFWSIAGDPRVLGSAFFLLALALTQLHEIGQYGVETDFYWTDGPIAKALRNGTIPNSSGFRGPGYALLLALVGTVVRDLFVAGKLISAISGAVLVGTTANFASRLGGPKAALVAGAFVAVQPLAVLHSWMAGTDMIFVAVAMLGLSLLARSLHGAEADSRGTKTLFAAGLILGYAFLVRPNGLVLLPVLLTWIWLLGTKGMPAQSRAKRTALCLIAFAVGPLLWNGIYLSTHNELPANTNYKNIAAAAFPDLQQINPDVYKETFDQDIQSYEDISGTILREVAAGTVQNVTDYGVRNARSVTGWPVTLLASLGAFCLLFARADRRFWLLPIAGLWVFFSLAPIYYAERFFLFLVGPSAFLATWLVIDPSTRTWRTLPFRKSPAADAKAFGVVAMTVFAGTCLASGWQTFEFNRTSLRDDGQLAPVLESADLIRSDTISTGAICVRKPQLPWLVDRKMVKTPQVPLDGLVEYLRAKDVSYLYCGEMEMLMAPELRGLFLSDQVPAELQLVYVRTALPFALLFRIAPEGWGGESIPSLLRSHFDILSQNLERTGFLAKSESRSFIDHYHRGTYHLSKGEMAKGLADLEQAVALRPDEPAVQLAFAHALLGTGQFARGLQAVEAAETLGLMNREVRLEKTVALSGLRRLDDAIVWLEDSLEDFPGDAEFTARLGNACALQGDYTKSKANFSAAESAGYSFDAHYFSQYASVLALTGDFSGSLTRLNQAVVMKPADADLRVRVAVLHYQLEDIKNAQLALDEALRINPSHENALNLRSQLK